MIKHKDKMIYVFWFLIFGTIGYFVTNLVPRPTISVIMSTYNRADMLPVSIDSILTQTYDDFEFIIVNDGSTDNTQAVLEQYANKDDRIVILKNEINKGLTYSLNLGLAAAKGRFIARMDDDDFSIPNRFEVQLNFMEQNPDVTVVGGPRHFSLKKDLNLQKKQIETFVQRAEVPYIIQEHDASYNAIISYFRVPIFHPSAFIRKAFLDEHDILYRDAYESAEDTQFWFEITQKGGKIISLPTAIVLRGTSNKKRGYYSEQLFSYISFLKESTKGVYNLPEDQRTWLSKEQECGILNGLEKYIGKKPFITDASLSNARWLNGCNP